MRIQALTHFDEKFRPVADITYPILKEYCKRHKYSVFAQMQRNSDRHPVWDKIQLLRELVDSADWTLYMDADVLVTNLTIPLDDLTATDKDMVIAHDVNGLNAGVFLFRSCAWTHEFLDNVWNIDHNHPIYYRGNNWHQTEAEQNAMKAMIADMPDTDKHISYVKQKRFNAYLYHVYNYPANQEGSWAQGDFALHLPGMNNERRVEIFNEKVNQIVYE